MRELYASDYGKWDEAVEEGHEAGGAEEEEDGGGGDSGGGDLGKSKKWGFGDSDGGDGFHGLNRHGDAEKKAGGDVIYSGEDEGGSEIEVGD